MRESMEAEEQRKRMQEEEDEMIMRAINLSKVESSIEEDPKPEPSKPEAEPQYSVPPSNPVPV